MIIDKEGRLFGKVSIIDILTLALIILMGYFFFRQLGVLGNKEVVQKLDQLELTFYQEEVNDFACEALKIGSPTKETFKNVSFGKITGVEVMPSIDWGDSREGEKTASSREGYNSVRIKTQVEGKLTNNGIIIGGEKFFIGDTIVFKAGNAIFFGDIAEVKEI